MIRISQLQLPIGHSPEDLENKIRKILSIKGTPREISYKIIRQSLDARKKSDKKFVYTVDVTCKSKSEERRILKRVHHKDVMLTQGERYAFPSPGVERLHHPPVIIGSGPAGLFCARMLAVHGYRPLVIERGAQAAKRKEAVEKFWQGGALDPRSNVQFGEGGAGTFSDGKLHTLIKDPHRRIQTVLQTFVDAGAPPEILYQQKPHLGTDALIDIVERIRRQIQEMGGCFLFETQVTDFICENGCLRRLLLDTGEEIPVQAAVGAIGHSARDTFETLYRRGFSMEAKSFAVGVRIEHPQEMINQALYGEPQNPLLGAASYKLTYQSSLGRGVYSFCMCPGGYVVNASSEEKALAVNGMSYQDRGGANANSALAVTVTPADYPDASPLGGVAYQRKLEQKAWAIAGGKIPVQLWEDYLNFRDSESLGDVIPAIKGEYCLGGLRGILPKEIGDSIQEAVLAFQKKIPGYARPDCLLSGVESRTSSPVRILRGPDMQSNIQGFYPCGEGAGYAGGITSAAIDGIKVAEAIAKKYMKIQ